MVNNKFKKILKNVYILGTALLMLSIGAIPTNAAVMHDIKKGESLYIIAKNNGLTVADLKQANGLEGDLILAGDKLAIPTGSTNASGRDIDLLARLVNAEAEGEPFRGKVAVASVLLNRLKDPKFPGTIPGNIFKRHEFESVSNGLIWERQPTQEDYQAVKAAFQGWDPAYGSKFFFNPTKVKGSSWVWTRQIVERIGNHVFGV